MGSGIALFFEEHTLTIEECSGLVSQSNLVRVEVVLCYASHANSAWNRALLSFLEEHTLTIRGVQQLSHYQSWIAVVTEFSMQGLAWP